MNQEKILDISIRAGSILLRYGAETYRVEDTIVRICKSYGLTCEAFALPTGVFVSINGESGASTIVKRIHSRTVDLTRISQLNDLSRRIERDKPEYDEVIAAFDIIANARSYSNLTILFCFALTAFAYALLFGGSLSDALSATVVGTLLGVMRMVFTQTMGSSFPFIEYFAGGFVSGLLGSLASHLFPTANAYVVIIGALTNLLPGVALTNGIRDLLHGDSLSGVSKLGEAILTVLVIVAGTGIGLTFWLIGGI